MRTAGIIAIAFAITMHARPAFADRGIVPYIGYNFGGDSSNCATLTGCEEKHTNFGVSVGAVGTTGLELDLGYAKNFFGVAPGTDNSVLTVMSNLVVGIPIGPVHPFVVGGIGLIRPHATLNPTALITSKNALGYDLGAGVALSLGKSFGLRGDIRRFSTFENLKLFVFTGGKLSFSRATIGLTLKY
jgi:opacity protein-like surface antigen